MKKILGALLEDFLCAVGGKADELSTAARALNDKLAAVLSEPLSPPTTKGSIMHSLDEALQAVKNADTRTDSIIADRAALKQQLADALSGVTLPPNVQAAIDSIFDVSTSDAQKIDAALNANVPPPPADQPPAETPPAT